MKKPSTALIVTISAASVCLIVAIFLIFMNKMKQEIILEIQDQQQVDSAVTLLEESIDEATEETNTEDITTTGTQTIEDGILE